MSTLTLNILDCDQAVHGEPHGGFVEAAIAALSAEPETIGELQKALARFIKPEARHPFFAGWARRVCDEPWDAGWCVVDLTARLVACRCTWFVPQQRGTVWYHDGRGATDVRLNYCLPADWLLCDDTDSWRALAERRRAERAALSPLDFRAVLYGKVTEYLVSECLSARAGGETDPIPAIHARWLLTPRSDLRDLPPRHWLLAKMGFISWDLQHRGEQWSLLGECPPGLAPDSAAFRLGGCGMHENVLYYDLLRYLLEECWDRVHDGPGAAAVEEVARLEALKEQWLRTPQYELHGKTPLEVIERERQRLPEVVSGPDAMFDPDCPLCQMMAEDFGPTFWHLDGSNMDPDFAFSFDLTREEWEQEQREWEEFRRRSEQERAAGESRPGEPLEASVWQRSYSASETEGSLSEGFDAELMLFGIGGHLAELRLDCQEKPDADGWRGALERDWGNLLAAARDDTRCLVAPVVQRFRDTLDGLAAAHPDLAAKCSDLDNQLAKVAARLTDLPF
jgi:hypothetical protein